MASHSAVLLVDCPDQRGIVAAIAEFLYRHGANILHSDQHQDNEASLFFMRIEFSLDEFTLDPDQFTNLFRVIAERFAMHWRLEYMARKVPLAIFVSRYHHCLVDLLYRQRLAELNGEIRVIISNHEDAAGLARFHEIPFHYLPVTAENRREAEAAQMRIVEEAGCELIVLARYMQILSTTFVSRFPHRIINVHHSFLPAFTGAKPYHAAFARGVKLIGATSHYVTDDLDEGPIIDQDVARVSHRDQVADLIERGRDLERMVLSRAVRWHLEHRILCYGNKTVIFD